MHHYTSDTVKFCAEQARKNSRRLEEKMKERLEWSDTKLLKAILVMLDTQSWHCTTRRSFEDDGEDEDGLTELKAAVENIITKFREPSEAKGVTLAAIQDELEEFVHYARKYISLGHDSYHKTWYKLHMASESEALVERLCNVSESEPRAKERVSVDLRVILRMTNWLYRGLGQVVRSSFSKGAC